MSVDSRDVELRPMPYPYKAMLAICSDLDETPDRHVYWEIMRFLNTTEQTAMGPGVGLEVGNTIYFDMPADQFAYWNTDEAGRAMVRDLIHSGHIDCLHSYGDLATTRGHAGRALDELTRHDCRLEVWIDHSMAPTNFGVDITCGFGDVRGSEVYHADLTCDYGVKYVWRGRVTSVTGQDVPPRLRGIFAARHPFASGRTLAKEAAKQILARRGNAKYAMHGPNRVVRTGRLRDGHAVYEFLRCNPHWRGVQHGDTASGLGDVLTKAFLDRLIEREAVCVLYTHLGKVKRRDEPFGPRTRDALRLLAEVHRDGEILVTTTRRLLGFRRAVRDVSIAHTRDKMGLRIDLSTVNDAGKRDRALADADLAGLTFYVPDPEAVRILLNGREVPDVCGNPADRTGRRSVSLRWSALEFPDL